MSIPNWLVGLVLVASAASCYGGRHARQDAPWIHLIPPEEHPSTPPSGPSKPAAVPPSPAVTPQESTAPPISTSNETGRPAEPTACPVNPDTLPTFIRMGHMGGDCRQQCENTLDAGRAGLANGLNAFELDLCMSADGVPFLWHDCDPTDYTARMRQFGKYVVNNNCLPYRHHSVSKRAPSQLSFQEIRQHFGYKRTWYKNDRIARYVVPTLREYLAEFGRNPSVERFYLDMKMPHAAFPQRLVNSALAIAKDLGIEHKLLFSFPTVGQVQSAQAQLPIFTQPGGTQSRLLLGLGVDPQDVIVSNSYRSNLDSAERYLSGLSRRYSLGFFDRVRVKYHLGVISVKVTGSAALSAPSIYSRLKKKLVPVKDAQRLCIPYVSLRYFAELTSLFGNPFYKSLISKALAERKRSGYPVKIISSNINDRRLAIWLRRQGVDGIMTDCPTLLW